eukprot:TRINITY_DN20467_c0_g1_i1.p1 TRINITY_DN20467_c0_g1~~TRINITY_DN20467_c0_g1_i1.p1  ORF type:complete len:853 (-),score=245.78 TRINITY_DN20467_c0_g1_i1:174-2732(-)
MDAISSPLRDRSNGGYPVISRSGGEEGEKRSGRRSLGGEKEEGEKRSGRRSLGGENNDKYESEIISFDEMKKQLSFWQSKLSDLSAEQLEAEKLRQDSSTLRGKLQGCEAEASDRARKLAQTRILVQEKSEELANVQSQLAQTHILLAKEKDIVERQRSESAEASDKMRDIQRRCVGLEAEAAALKAELAAEKVQASRQRDRGCQLDQELARATRMVADLQERSQKVEMLEDELRAQTGKVENLSQELGAECAARAADRYMTKQLQDELSAQKAKVESLAQELTVEREASEAERGMARALEADLAEAAREKKMLEDAEAQKRSLETEVASLHEELQTERELSTRHGEELRAVRAEASSLSRQLEATTTSLQRELESERELVSLQQSQLQEMTARTELLHEKETLAEKQQTDIQELERMLAEVRKASECHKQEAERMIEELDDSRRELERLSHHESDLRAALEGQCQQLADGVRKQEELRAHVQLLEEERSQGQERLEDLSNQLDGVSHASDANAHILQSEISQLKDALGAAGAETKLWRDRAEVLVRRRKAAASAATRWEGTDAAWEWLLEQSGEGAQELDELPEGSELRLQNRELCLSLRQFKQDCEHLEAENVSLKRAVSAAEGDLDRISDQHAQLMGHVNHRQKIRYTMKLKEEMNRLSAELKKARQKILQLEVSKECDGLFDALAAVVGTDHRKSAHCRLSSAMQTTPRGPAARPARRMASSVGGVGLRSISSPQQGGAATEGLGDALRLQEAERRCEMQQHALERISIDFQHLKALIERAVMLADTEQRYGIHGSSFAVLLQHLRDIIAASHKAPATQQGTPERLPVPATPIHNEDDDELIPVDSGC